MSANLPITGWPAHDSSVCSLRFGPDETSIFSMGSDGKVSLLEVSDQITFICITFSFLVIRVELAESRKSPLVERLQQVFKKT